LRQQTIILFRINWRSQVDRLRLISISVYGTSSPSPNHKKEKMVKKKINKKKSCGRKSRKRDKSSKVKKLIKLAKSGKLGKKKKKR